MWFLNNTVETYIQEEIPQELFAEKVILLEEKNFISGQPIEALQNKLSSYTQEYSKHVKTEVIAETATSADE